jgi:hypothetical protein
VPQVSAVRLLLQDLTHDPPLPGALPPAWDGTMPRLARLLTLDRLAVTYGANLGCNTATHVEAHDLAVEGFAGEAGSFMSRCVCSSGSVTRCSPRLQNQSMS